MQGIENLQFAHAGMSWVCKVAMIRVDGQCAESIFIGGCFTDRVQHLHVPDVVDEQRLFKAHNKPLKEIVFKKEGPDLSFQNTIFVRLCSSSRPESSMCSCNCRFRCPSWSGRPSTSGARFGWQWPQGCLKITSRRCTHLPWLK